MAFIFDDEIQDIVEVRETTHVHRRELEERLENAQALVVECQSDLVEYDSLRCQHPTAEQVAPEAPVLDVPAVPEVSAAPVDATQVEIAPAPMPTVTPEAPQIPTAFAAAPSIDTPAPEAPVDVTTPAPEMTIGQPEAPRVEM